MSDVSKLVETYKIKGVKSALSHPGFEHDLKSVKAGWAALEPEAQGEIKEFLRGVLDALDERLLSLNTNLSQKMQEMERQRCNSQACIHYLNTARGTKR